MTEQEIAGQVESGIGRAMAAHKASLHSPIRLSKSEANVFRLIGLGLTNQEVAARLFISNDTVRTHLKRIHDKCDIRGRSMLTVVSCLMGEKHGYPHEHPQA